MANPTDSALYIHWLTFQLECLKRSGTAFQSFFEEIMAKAHDSFTAIKPWGTEGDRKCDGLLLDERVMFQVYAPDRLNAARTVKKIEEDFAGAKANWPSLRRWVFVSRHPLPPSVARKLADLKEDSAIAGIAVNSWNLERLWDEVKKLSPQQRVELLGPAPAAKPAPPLLQAPPCRADELDLEALGVDAVDPTILRQAAATTDTQLAYVSRGEVDGRLRRALQEAVDGSGTPVVCVYGASKSGKTRTMLEAIRTQLPDAIVIAPEPGRENMQAVLEHGVCERAAGTLGAPVVLWLDDLESSVRVDRAGIGWLQIEELIKAVPSLVIAATAGGRGLASRLPRTHSEIVDPMRRLLDRAHQELLLAELATEHERGALRAVVGANLASKMEEGLGEVAVAGPELVATLVSKRHRNASDGAPHHDGAALAWAALVAFRLGVTEPLPERFLRTLFACFVDNPELQRFEQGLQWATEPIHAHVALVRRRGQRGFVPYDYVVQHAPERDDAATRCSWTKILRAVSVEDIVWLGVNASGTDRDDYALDALKRAEELGSEDGALMLGLFLESRGRQKDANQVWERADSRGYAEGTARLARARRAEGKLDEAVQLLAKADRLGHPEGPVDLGKLLLERGDRDGAEAAWRRAVERGSAAGARNLAVFLRDERHDPAGSEAAWRRADDRGDPDAAVSMGLIYQERGDHENAESAFRRADARESPAGARMLGNILFLRGDRVGAGQSWTRADERGDAGGAFGVGNRLQEHGDLQGALEAWKRAEARGSAQAAMSIGLHFEKAGDEAAANAAFQRSADLGESQAANHLGVHLRSRGESTKAEAALNRAVELGSDQALMNLGILHLERGDREIARDFFKRAARSGDRGLAAAAVSALQELDDDAATV